MAMLPSVNERDRSRPASLSWRVEEAYAAEVELERARWKAITAFVELLSDDERLAPGYYLDPDWSVKDLVAHLGAWMLKARSHLVDIAARSYENRMRQRISGFGRPALITMVSISAAFATG
jgi:hypothetical protein